MNFLFQLARRGHFEVVSNIFQYIPAAKEAKAHLDHVIDLCGDAPRGLSVFYTYADIQVTLTF